MLLSVSLNVILGAGLAAALWKLKAYREDRKQRGLFKPWPIKRVDADEFDDRFKTDRLGPRRDTEIRAIAAFRVEGGISDFETWFLCNLAKQAESVFELGTCTGKTTYLLARNTPPGAKIVTLTLAPDGADRYCADSGDDEGALESAIRESQFDVFVYSNTPEASKVEQLFGDSKEFDETPYLEAFDLVFVDGSHAKSYVESDSRKAVRMARPGGIVVWHDYRGPRRTPGVFQALNELAKDLPLVHIRGTSMVAYRKPAGV